MGISDWSSDVCSSDLELLGGRLAGADEEAVQKRSAHWSALSRATVSRKASALRRFFAFLADEGDRADDPSRALPRPTRERGLPKILSHKDVDALFEALERKRATAPGPAVDRLSALMELLYGSGLRATELVSLPRHARSEGHTSELQSLMRISYA